MIQCRFMYQKEQLATCTNIITNAIGSCHHKVLSANGKYLRVSHILQFFYDSKIWETRKIFINIARGNVR